MAVALGFRLKPVLRDGAALFGQAIFYDRRETWERQQGLVRRCLALYAMRRCGLRVSRGALDYVAEGLARPQEPERRRSGVLPLGASGAGGVELG